MPLSFPQPDLPGSREIQFRDGKREVPEYLANLMGGLDTVKYTFDEALDQVNKGLIDTHVNRAYDKLIARHFKGGF